MIDIPKREELDRTVLQSPWDENDFRGIIRTDWPFVIHYRNDAAEVNAWIREAVRWLRAYQSDHPHPDQELDLLIKRVKL